MGRKCFKTYVPSPYANSCMTKAVWLCIGNRTITTDTINVHMTSCRPSSAGRDAAVKGVAPASLQNQPTVLLTCHIQLATIHTYRTTTTVISMAPFFQLIRCKMFGVRPRLSLTSKKFSFFFFQLLCKVRLNPSLSHSSPLLHPACYLS